MTRVLPPGPLTPHGWYHLTHPHIPQMWLDSYDESVRIHLMGGYAIPDRMAPECVRLTGLDGLVPPWKHIQQKGASEDGVTHIDALYDPTEIKCKFRIQGRDNQARRETQRLLVDSIDAKQQSTLNFLTHEMGHWWAPVRWFQGGDNAVKIVTEQELAVRLQGDDAFWRTYDDTAAFTPTYATLDAQEFDEELTGWPVHRYEGGGAGGPVGTPAGIKWAESGTTGASVVLGPFEGFDTLTDNQTCTVTLGSAMEWGFLDGAFFDLWCRQNRDGDEWGGDGIRFRVGQKRVLISGWVDYVKVWERQWLKPIPPLWGEKFTAVAGVPGNPRKYQLQRGGVPIFTITEQGTQTRISAAHRGTGLGLRAGNGILSQASPAIIRGFTAGDNALVTQQGFLARTNVGDQPMYDDYTLFGPFNKVRIWDGPASDAFVEFGPLLPGQIVFLRTDARSQTTLVQDLTSAPPPTGEANTFAAALDKFLSFAALNGAFGDQIKSLFGIKAPQGNLYKYLKGRFSENAAIPAKSPGSPAQPYFVKVEIEGGTAESKIIASGTPLRRSPF